MSITTTKNPADVHGERAEVLLVDSLRETNNEKLPKSIMLIVSTDGDFVTQCAKAFFEHNGEKYQYQLPKQFINEAGSDTYLHCASLKTEGPYSSRFFLQTILALGEEIRDPGCIERDNFFDFSNLYDVFNV